MAIPKPHSENPFQWKPLRSDQDIKNYEALLNEAFQVSTGHTFFEDFPVWNHPLPSPRLQLGVWDHEQLVGGACARIAEVQFQGLSHSLKVGFLGGIVTHEKYRGKGLASEATQKLLDWLKRQHIPLAVLWGSEYSLYQKLGFELCGIQYRIPIGQLDLPKKRLQTGYQLHYGWAPAIFDLIQKRSCGVVLVEQDRAWYEAHKNVQWVWAQSPMGVEAYVGWNRGIDLNGMIHEWGGQPEALLVLLNYLQHQKPDLEIIGHPAIFEEFEIKGAPGTEEYLCLANILDLKAILDQFGILENPQNQNLHHWLFGPSISGARPSGSFQGLPLWFWGLDAC